MSNFMEIIQSSSFEHNPSFVFADPQNLQSEKPKNQDLEEVSAMEEDDSKESLEDLMVCDSGSTLVQKGFAKPNCAEEIVFFLNAGAAASVETDHGISFLADKFFDGGDTFQTEENITDSGDYPFVYQSARLGNFSYRIDGLPPGDYVIDLHFVEMINIFGPKGMRVFNVFMQDEKVLSDFDIFSIVGANKPVQLVGSRVSVKEGGALVIRFDGVIGSPVVSGICVRKASELGSKLNRECLTCSNCSSEIEIPSAQKKGKQMKSTVKYEKKIHELSDLLQRKTDECYQSWMSWTAANEQLEKVRMELDNKTFQTYSLDQTLERQAEELKDVANRYKHDKQFWAVAINDLQKKVQIMKQEHYQLSREAHECADSIPELNKMISAVHALVDQCEEYKMKYNEEQAKRRKLFNQVQEAKGNIRVFCRCRPLSKTEALAGCSTVVDFEAAKDGDLGVLSGGSTKKIFRFDRVYSPKDDQADVFSDASPMVISVLDGYNVCIFAYGQTGTGKTFTMEGTEENRGVNYRTLEELFKIAQERSETFTYNLSVTVLEVYNEQIRDLLATSSASKRLEIKQASEGFHHVPGVVEAEVNNIKDVWNVLQAGSSARSIGSNNVNEHSSRSHCMLCVTVKAKNSITGECTKSKLWLVDLAGSERLAKTDVQGDRLKEAQNINRSLSALGDVISALANKSSHIPYRNSKLTHLLQDSLGGDSKTLMFVQISPSEKDLSETLSSLNFASRVRGIELGVARKQIDPSELQKMKATVDKVKQECRSKDESLRKLEDSLQSLENKARGKEVIVKNQQDRIKELELQLESKTLLQLQSEKQVSQVSERLKGREETCASLQEKVIDLEKKLRQQEHFESAAYEKKVKDLESKLKEQVQESEAHSIFLQQKIEQLEGRLKEAEENRENMLLCQKVLVYNSSFLAFSDYSCLKTKLKEQVQESEARSIFLQQKIEQLEERLKEAEENRENMLLRQKIKELEDMLKDQKQHLPCASIVDSAQSKSSRSTPLDVKHFPQDVTMRESEHRILRNSNVLNHQFTSARAKDDSHQNVRRKRLSRNAEIENNAGVPTFASDNRGRQSDPPKPSTRVMRTTARPTITTTQRQTSLNKTTRDPVQGIKERETKKRIWSR